MARKMTAEETHTQHTRPAEDGFEEVVNDIDTVSGAAADRYRRSREHARNDPAVSPLSSQESLHIEDDEKSMFGEVLSGINKHARSVYGRVTSSAVKEKHIIIAVMGMTGSGKTTFISKATGRDDLQIGHELVSCTRDIQVFETKINGQRVHFVDTPGFSDTTLSDTDVLQMIADYLAAAYKKEMKLSGIIYIHPISDTRMTHQNIKNLDMFRKLTGEKNLKNVVLATSKWDQVTRDQGEAREVELCNRFWRVLTAYGAQVRRHFGTTESARQIAKELVANTPFYLQLQEEMGQDNKTLRDTAAGQELMAEMTRMKEQHQKEVADLQRMMRGSADESKAVIEALREEYRRQLEQLERILRDERKMNEEAVKSLQERINALENRGGGCIVM